MLLVTVAIVVICITIMQLMLAGMAHDCLTDSMKNTDSVTSRFFRRFQPNHRNKVLWAIVAFGEIYLIAALLLIVFYLIPRSIIKDIRKNYRETSALLNTLDNN